jgi:hypothetical protein
MFLICALQGVTLEMDLIVKKCQVLFLVYFLFLYRLIFV